MEAARQLDTIEETTLPVAHKINDRFEIVRLYEGGLAIAEIARKFSVTDETIRYHLRSSGLLELAKRKFRYPGELPKDREVRKMYESGMGTVDIAKRFDVGRSAVYEALMRAKAAMRTPRKPRKLPATEKMRRLYIHEGLTSVQIAKMYGTSPSNVIRRLRTAGIPTRPRGKGNKRDASRCRFLVDGKPCGKPVKKIYHTINKSWYGTMCAYHRKLHYARLNRWEQRIKHGRSPDKWKYQHEANASPETKALAAVISQVMRAAQTRFCPCGAPITYQSKTGYCQPCSMRNLKNLKKTHGV